MYILVVIMTESLLTIRALERLAEAHERLAIALESLAESFARVTKEMSNGQTVFKIDGYVGIKQ